MSDNPEEGPNPFLATLALPELKLALGRMIDEAAEVDRLRSMTAGNGMVMTYQEKLSQARAVLALGEAAAVALSTDEAIASYPTLAASVGIEAGNLWQAAQTVVARYGLFARRSYAVERGRLTAKAAIQAAGSREEALAAHAALGFPATPEAFVPVDPVAQLRTQVAQLTAALAALAQQAGQPP